MPLGKGPASASLLGSVLARSQVGGEAWLRQGSRKGLQLEVSGRSKTWGFCWLQNQTKQEAGAGAPSLFPKAVVKDGHKVASNHRTVLSQLWGRRPRRHRVLGGPLLPLPAPGGPFTCGC